MLEIVLVVVAVIILLYIVHRFWPNSLAKKLMYEAFEGVSDEILLRHIEAGQLVVSGTKERIDLEWPGWDRYEESHMETILGVLGGYGEIFKLMIRLKRMYFREIVRHVGRAEVARRWLRDGIMIGLLRKERDSDGATVYVIDRDGLRRIIEYIDAALGELIGEHG